MKRISLEQLCSGDARNIYICHLPSEKGASCSQTIAPQRLLSQPQPYIYIISNFFRFFNVRIFMPIISCYAGSRARQLQFFLLRTEPPPRLMLSMFLASQVSETHGRYANLRSGQHAVPWWRQLESNQSQAALAFRLAPRDLSPYNGDGIGIRTHNYRRERPAS